MSRGLKDLTYRADPSVLTRRSSGVKEQSSFMRRRAVSGMGVSRVESSAVRVASSEHSPVPVTRAVPDAHSALPCVMNASICDVVA